MVELKKIVKGKKEYYYLVHSYRDGKKVQKKQIYLGKEIPKNINEIKKKFVSELYREKFLNDIDSIKKNYTKEHKTMPKSIKEKEIEAFAIKFTYNSQKIEGSKLSLRETADLLERGITPSSKPIRDVKEAEAHQKLFYEMIKYKKDLNLQKVLYWNKILLGETKKEIAGKIRSHQVAISGSKFMPPFPAEIYPLLREFFSWYNKNKDKIYPVELAALVHLKFVTIHPFGDGNGRISRIMMNFILNKKRFPMFDISYGKRTSYYNALERAQLNNNEGIFLQWFFKRYLAEYKIYLK